jgi:hypothetical protein
MPVDRGRAAAITEALSDRLGERARVDPPVDRRTVLGGLSIAGLIRDDGGRVGTATNLLAFLVGFAAMYATDLLVVF